MFGIPDSCKSGDIVHKKLFYENGGFSSADRELFTNAVDKIICCYCLKPANINIARYKDDVREYHEIEVLEVRISDNLKVRRMAELIFEAIPYPMLLVFLFGEESQLWAAHRRINRNDASKDVLEDFVSSDWLAADSELFRRLNIGNMNMTDYYTLYCDIVDTITIWNAESAGLANKGCELSAEELREIMAKIEELDKEIATLTSKICKESQFNARVAMNVELKKLKEKKEELKGNVK